jgi:hypothetical protein
MNGERLLAALEALRQRLQRHGWLARLAAWCGVAGLVAAGLATAAVALDLIGLGTALLLLLAAGVLAALAAAWQTLRRPLTLPMVAAWVDRAVGAQGLFAAGLLCVQRQHLPGKGVFDEAVIQAAEDRLSQATALRVPRRFWVRPLLLAGAVLAALVLVLLPWSGGAAAAGWTLPATAPYEATPQQVAAAKAEVAAALPFVDPSATPEELAMAMFPDKPELARLLAAALRAGRLDEVRELVDRAALAQTNLAESRGSEASDPDTSGERASEKPENTTRVDADGEASAGSQVEQTSGQEGGRGDQKEDSDYLGESAPMPAPPDGLLDPGVLPLSLLNRPGGARPPAGGGEGEEGDDDSAGGGRDEAAATDDNPGELVAGSGSGAAAQWGEIAARATGDNLVIRPLDGGAYFELVLPGGDSSLTAVERLQAALAAAEAALARSSLPAEYQNAIREYYLALIAQAGKGKE